MLHEPHVVQSKYARGPVPPNRQKVPSAPARAASRPAEVCEQTAIIYCERNFGGLDGKTANGLVRHSETYRILAVIDSDRAGQDSGEVLDGCANGIPIFRDLDEAVRHAPRAPDCLIIGMAPTSGRLSVQDRGAVLDALAHGMTIVSGLHEFLSDDPEFIAASGARAGALLDVRKPRASKDLRLFDGQINAVTCPRIAILGTDCAIGKRTTATLLTRALNERGVKAVMVGTGQTGLLQGARYGVALDAIPSQFCCGEMEGAVVAAFVREDPDVIIIEGQGSLSHPAFCTSASILRGSNPHGVILQHAPRRAHRCDFPDIGMPAPADEIDLIERFADTKVIGLTLNHEGMSATETDLAISQYERELGILVTDALRRPTDELAEIVLRSYPDLRRRPVVAAE